MKKRIIEKKDRKVIIHEFLVAEFQYDFSQHKI